MMEDSPAPVTTSTVYEAGHLMCVLVGGACDVGNVEQIVLGLSELLLVVHVARGYDFGAVTPRIVNNKDYALDFPLVP